MRIDQPEPDAGSADRGDQGDRGDRGADAGLRRQRWEAPAVSREEQVAAHARNRQNVEAA
jgi:hypothetical protein